MVHVAINSNTEVIRPEKLPASEKALDKFSGNFQKPVQTMRSMNENPEILGYDKELIKNGYIKLSDRPDFWIKLNEELLKEYLFDGEEWWEEFFNQWFFISLISIY